MYSGLLSNGFSPLAGATEQCIATAHVERMAVGIARQALDEHVDARVAATRVEEVFLPTEVQLERVLDLERRGTRVRVVTVDSRNTAPVRDAARRRAFGHSFDVLERVAEVEVEAVVVTLGNAEREDVVLAISKVTELGQVVDTEIVEISVDRTTVGCDACRVRSIPDRAAPGYATGSRPRLACAGTAQT